MLLKHHQQLVIWAKLPNKVTDWIGHRLPTILRDLQILYNPDWDYFNCVWWCVLLSDYKGLCRALLLFHGFCDNKFRNISRGDSEEDNNALRGDIIRAILLMRVHKETDQQAHILTLTNHNKPLPILNPVTEHPLTPFQIRHNLLVQIRLQLATHLSSHHLRLQLTPIVAINQA